MKIKSFFKKLIVLFLILFVGSKLNIISRLKPLFLGSNLPKPITISENYRSIDGIVSSNAIAIHENSSQIVMGKNYEKRIHPASMTKVMTAIIGLEKAGNLNDRVSISQDIIDYCIQNGLSVSGFEAGDKPRVKDLLYGILLESGGESSIALARYISGTEEEFASLMNEKALTIGMDSTHFSNPTGITDENNYSTVKDIALLFNYAIKNKNFKKIVETQKYEATGIRGKFTKEEIYNNLFYKRNSMNISKDYIRCGKTGYTSAAGLCLVSCGSIDDEDYIVVTAHANGNSQTEQFNLTDTVKIYEQLKLYR